MSKKLFGLGKGLGSLIPQTGGNGKADTNQKEKVFYVEVHKIRPNPDQPRQDFDESALKDLAGSIRKYGVLQPLLVSKHEDHTPRGLDVYYELIAGERRLRASQLAGLPQVPVIIRDDEPERGTSGKSERLELALIENLQRENLNPMEEAEAYERLSSEFGLTQKEIGEKVSKSREAVANTIRLVKLPKYIKDALRAGKITGTHARALLAFETEDKQKEVYEQIIQGGFSTKDVEASAANMKPGQKGRKANPKFVELQENLGTKLNVPVVIKAGAKGGQIVIRFATHEELNTIAKAIID
jgi:ParB family chromosome partitioning protein